jgi:hypothetical protein
VELAVVVVEAVVEAVVVDEVTMMRVERDDMANSILDRKNTSGALIRLYVDRALGAQRGIERGPKHSHVL